MTQLTKFNVECTDCNEVVNPNPPENKRRYGVLLALALGGLGGAVGGTIGIASGGLGAPAIIPLGLMGLVAGWLFGAWIARMQDGITCPQCESRFGSRIPFR